ncbi:TPA: chorismate mutase [Bacillus luti]|nr:chorismate mutase [Bacillus luti]
MKRMNFERPTDHYDERLYAIDEKICTLLKERKELSDGNPGFPADEAISNWAKQYGLYPDYLNSLFSSMMDEEEFKPRVEPNKFKKHIPVLKTFEQNGTVYTVTFIRQYSNASVVYLYKEWDSKNNKLNEKNTHTLVELSVNDTYDCWAEGWSGSDGHVSYQFVVSPALSNNLSGIRLLFKERSMPFMKDQTVLQFEIQVD